VLLLIVLAVVALTLKKNVGNLLSEAFQPPPPVAEVSDAETEELESFDGIPELNDQVIDDIQEYASENPERVAEVIQSWIHEVDLGKPAKRAVGG